MKAKETKELTKTEKSRMLSPFEEMERFLEETWKRPFSWFERPSWLPGRGLTGVGEVSASIDLYEDGNDIVVTAELPGIDKENIDVHLTEDSLTISGEKKKEEKLEEKNYYRFERSYGSFSRRIAMPVPIQTDKAKAHFKDGVLEIRVPKTEEARKKEKKVPIE